MQMRTPKREIKDKALVEALLLRAQYVTLAMWDGSAPYSLPISFGYEAGNLYFHCSLRGKKAHCLKTCPKVSFSAVLDAKVVTREGTMACAYTAHYQSVVGLGRVEFIEDPQEKIKALNCMMRHYQTPEGPYDPAVLEKTMVVRVAIEELRGKSAPPLE
jgi:nitroimidazol reductase NimA-like FMN-containing flavoprotein (pyridoxamine 5'-phosphate oxidase superfamily)